MFTIEQIKAAHSKVRTGADFPAYVQDIAALGVSGYETYVTDGHTVYHGDNNFRAVLDARYPPLEIAGSSNGEKFSQELKAHQQGKSDYPAFCKACAETGIEKWVVDTKALTCTYYDKGGNEILAEAIPKP